MKSQPSVKSRHLFSEELKGFVFRTFFGLTLICLPSFSFSRAAAYQIAANVMVEIQFESKLPHADPFNEVSLEVVFSDPSGKRLRVPAFWTGATTWKVRYASGLIGRHDFLSECTDTNDKGLHGIHGVVEIKPYIGDNPLYRHGPLKVASDHRHLEHVDGTPFFWLGDTWWMGLCHRLHFPDEFDQLAADRKQKGFTGVQIVAGLYPDMPPFDPRGANEAGFPWETNYSRIRPEYFDAADQRLKNLIERGMTPCIVGAWGFFLPRMGIPKMEQHWRYLIARYGAWPVIWCIAGEANLPYYLAKNFPYDDREQVKDWTEVARYVRKTDPFHRLTTIHPTGLNRLSARNAIDDVSLLDIDLLQTPHGENEAVAPTVRNIRASFNDAPALPVIDGEASYEMGMDKTPAEWPRAMFWICLLNGAAGHTYGANGIWQCNRREQPHGKSPHGNSYGKISWDEAMRLPGSAQVGLGKKFLEKFPWQSFVPHPEWAMFADEQALSLENSHWIWFPEPNPNQNSPLEKRYFRKSFALPASRQINRARLLTSADEPLEIHLNGQNLGQARDWHIGKEFNDLATILKPGTNVLSVRGQNKHAGVSANPPGFSACFEVQLQDGPTVKIVSDATWLCSKVEEMGWDRPDFDDSAWAKATEIGRYGTLPWGNILADSVLEGPQSAGIPRKVRITWVPKKKPVRLRNLDKQLKWSATHFNPVTGKTEPLPNLSVNESGTCLCQPPSGPEQDWVLILQPSGVAKIGTHRK